MDSLGTAMVQVADGIAYWHQGIQQAPLPRFEVEEALRLSLGLPTSPRLPRALLELIPAAIADEPRWIKQLDDLIRLRLVQGSVGASYTVLDGEASFDFKGMCVRVTVVPGGCWFVTRADSRALCTLLQRKLVGVSVSDRSFYPRLARIVDEFLRRWTIDRFIAAVGQPFYLCIHRLVS